MTFNWRASLWLGFRTSKPTHPLIKFTGKETVFISSLFSVFSWNNDLLFMNNQNTKLTYLSTTYLVYLKSVIENFEEGKSLIYWLIIRHEKTDVFHTQLLNSLKLKHKADRYTTCQICQHFQCCAIYENLRYVVYFCPSVAKSICKRMTVHNRGLCLW